MTARSKAGSPTAPHRLRDLDPQQRRRILLWATVRSVLLTAAMTALYFLWPLDALPNTARELIGPALALTVFVGVLVWQLRAITSSNLPELRSVEALVVVGTVFLALTSLVYLYLDASMANGFSETLTRMSALYFTVTVFATVGFGDITATTDATRAAVTIQMVLGLILVGFIVKVLLATAKLTLERRADAADDQQAEAEQ
ncbi:MAG: two pore domain potassium channel family protein [Actinobacteria bacterium]|nr:two pore domain potassium channel family protein [Actinomycetota bacterium]MCB9413022.1 two pore domain potassium channel family protein [Actinomycetota bacterium]